MRLQRLRIQVDDQPGRLGEVGVALGKIGVNVLGIDVQNIDGSSLVDEIVADLIIPIDVPAIEHVLRKAGASLVEVRAADVHDLRDRTTAALELAAALVADGTADHDRLAEAASLLVQAELAHVEVATTPGEGTPIARRVREGRSQAQVEGATLMLPARDAPTWHLGVPLEPSGAGSVLVLVRRRARFTYTETARVQALLRVHDAARSRRGVEVVRLADAGAVEVRELRASDLDALVRLHRRCSPTTVHRRYFSLLPTSPARFLEPLVRLDGSSRVGLVAMLGSEIVGVAHAFTLPGGDVELAFLVEDAHQRRGIGGVLFDRLAQRFVDRGVHELHAIALPDNDGVRRLLARVPDRSTEWDGGLLRITVRLTGTPVVTRGC